MEKKIVLREIDELYVVNVPITEEYYKKITDSMQNWNRKSIEKETVIW